MAQITPRVSEVLEKARSLPAQERGLLIDHLIESLDEGPAEEGVEEAWAEEIKHRVDDIRSGKVKMIPIVYLDDPDVLSIVAVSHNKRKGRL